MKANVFLKVNGQNSFVTIEAENNQDACQKAFDMAFQSEEDVEITAIRFNQERLIPWNSTAAHYCFAKGRCTVTEFIEWCKSPKELVNENGPVFEIRMPKMVVSPMLNLTNPAHQLIIAEQEKAIYKEKFELARHQLMAATRRVQDLKATIHFNQKQTSHV